MRILHVYKDYFPVLGGIENHIRMLAEGQAERGHEVSVLVTSRDRHTHVEMIGGVRVIFAARLATISSAPVSLSMFRLLAKERPDIIHLQSPYPWGELSDYIFGRGGGTVLSYQSDIVRQKYLRLLYAPLMRRVLDRVDAIIATSPNYVETSHVLSHYRQKCTVVPLGIDPSRFMKENPRAPSSIEEKGQSGSQMEDSRAGNVILFVGRLRYYKGVGFLLRAMSEVPNARLVVVGTGPMESEWKSLTQELNLLERVSFAGDVSEADLPAFYESCDVFVLPCSERSEAFGLVQLEAMAAGKPVVSCDVGTGVAWVNENGLTGLTVPPRDPTSLAEAINRLLEDRELAGRMGDAGRKRVLAEFTIGKMIDRVMGVYAQVMSRNKPQRRGRE